MTATVSALDAAFVFAVTGAAMVFPPLGLLVGFAYLAVIIVLHDRRTPEATADA